MAKQFSFQEARWTKARKTRLSLVLENLERCVDWAALAEKIEPHYPKPGRGRQPIPLGSIIRITAATWLLGANERQIEEALIDTPALCAFCLLDDSKAAPPDSETVANFRRMLERVGLGSCIVNSIELDLTRQQAFITPGQIREPTWRGPALRCNAEVVNTTE